MRCRTSCARFARPDPPGHIDTAPGIHMPGAIAYQFFSVARETSGVLGDLFRVLGQVVVVALVGAEDVAADAKAGWIFEKPR